MAIVSDVEIRLRADIARLQQDMNAARRSVSGAVSDMKKTLAGLVGGFSLVALGREIVNAQREFDKLNSSLITATGSTSNAKEAFAALQKFAASTPYSLQEVTEAFLKLRNLGLTPSEAALTSYGNTASAMGKGLNQLIEAVADAATGEFERLKEFGIKAKQQGDIVSFTFQGVTTKVGNNAKEIEAYIKAIGDVQFAGGMERQAATLDGALSNLGDTWSQTLIAFSQSGFGDVVQGSVKALTGSLGDLAEMFKAVSGAATTESGVVEEIGPIHAGLTTIFETLTVLGMNVAFVFKAIGKDLGTFAAQAAALFSGGMSGLTDGSTLRAVQAMGKARVEEAKREREEVDKNSEAVLNAAAKAKKAREEAAGADQLVEDALAKYAIQIKGVKELTDAQKKAAADRAKIAAKNLQDNREYLSALELKTAASKREADGLEPLNDAEKEAIELTERLRLGKIKMTAAQEARARAEIEENRVNLVNIESMKVYKDYMDDQLKVQADLDKARADAIKSATDEAEKNEQLAKTFGMTAVQIERVELARLKEQLAAKDSDNLTRSEIEQLEKLIALKERSIAAMANVEAMEETKKFWTDIEKTAHDTFVSIADGGKGMWKRLKDTGKNMFFEWLYSMTAKKWLINVGASFSGTGGVSGIAGAASALGGSSSILSSLGSSVAGLYGAITGGATLAGGLGTGFLGSLAGGLNGAGVGSGLTSALGLNIGTSIASTVGPAVATGISSALSMAATALPWVAGAFAAYTIATKAFGRGPKEFTGNSTLSGTLGDSFSGSINSEWIKKGGWFRSDKTGSDSAAVGAEMSAGLTAAYDSIKAAATSYAQVLGQNADSIASRTQAISIALGKDEAVNQKAIADFFSGVADTVAREVVPNLDRFTAAGETAAATLQRITTNFQMVDAALATLGLNSQTAFGAVGLASLDARERLVALSGGVQALGTQTQFFADNFLTRAQQIAPLQKQVNDQLAALGYAGLTTADQFKAAVLGLVESGALATEAGAKTYTGLLAVAPGFKTLTDYLTDIAGSLRTKADDALQVLSRSVDAQKDVVAKAYAESMTQMEASLGTVSDAISRNGALSQALRGAMRGVDSPEQQAASRQAAGAQIAAALAIAKASGVLPSADDLRDALGAISQDSGDQFATLADYQRSTARMNAQLAQLGDLTDDQVSTAERQLKTMQEQRDIARAANETELARLDGLLTYGQAQLDAANGIKNSVLDVGTAMNEVLFAIRDLKAASGGFVGPLTGYAPPPAGPVSMGVPMVASVPQSGTMGGSAAAMQAALDKMQQSMEAMQTSSAQTAQATVQFAGQFNNVSAGGNTLLVETV